MEGHSTKEDGRPADQWYWDDWFSSHDVQSCSFAAQGLWINLLGIMFSSQIRGTLTINLAQMDNKAIAKRFGKKLTEVNKLITELEEGRVFDRLGDGTIISRRMFRKSQKKEQISEIRSMAGKKGMNSRWGRSDNKTLTKDNNKTITNITASSPTPTPASAPSPKKENIRSCNNPKCLNMDHWECQFNHYWTRFPKSIGKVDTHSLFLSLCKKGLVEELIKGFNGYLEYLEHQRYHKNFDQEPMNSARFLRKENWKEYIGFKCKPKL